jgi:hypothetical protein
MCCIYVHGGKSKLKSAKRAFDIKELVIGKRISRFLEVLRKELSILNNFHHYRDHIEQCPEKWYYMVVLFFFCVKPIN